MENTEKNQPKTELILIENLTGDSLVNVTEWEKKIADVIEQNPVIEIVDNTTYELQKKARTNVKGVRVEIEKQDKVIASEFTRVRKQTMDATKKLLGGIEPFEEKHQDEVNRWEKIKSDEKKAKDEAEQKRIDGIKQKISELETSGYEVIQSMTWGGIETDMHYLSDILETTFDFEEYDILWQQAKSRIETAYENKQHDLQEKEAQRAENERLASEAKEREAQTNLQNDRLAKIAQYIPFTTGLNVIELHAYTDAEFTAIFDAAKSLKDAADQKAVEEKEAAKRQENERMENERIEREKADAEKQKVFEVRKNRLKLLGFEIDHLNDFSSLNCSYSLSVEDVKNFNEGGFEEAFIQAYNSIEKRKEEIEIEIRFEQRVIELKSIGYSDYRNNEMAYNQLCPVSHFNIQTMTDDEWSEFLRIAHEAIADYQAKIKASEKENKARQKALAGDKKVFAEFIHTLDFRGDVPEAKNDELKNLHVLMFDKLDQFKKQLLTDLENL